MRRVTRPALPRRAQTYLDQRQSAVNQHHGMNNLDVQRTWTAARQTNAMVTVLKTLQQTARRRTSYISVPREVPGALNAQVIDVEVGGATVFVLNVERFEHI